MKRTQIYLDPEIFEVLKVESKLKRTRISSLIREALREKYSVQGKKAMVIDQVAGIWKDRIFDVESYVRKKRNNKRRNVLNSKHYPMLSSQYLIN